MLWLLFDFTLRPETTVSPQDLKQYLQVGSNYPSSYDTLGKQLLNSSEAGILSMDHINTVLKKVPEWYLV